MKMIFTPLPSNDNKKSCDNCFCSAHNNLIFVMVSMLFVGRYARWVATRTGTVPERLRLNRLHRGNTTEHPTCRPSTVCLSLARHYGAVYRRDYSHDILGALDTGVSPVQRRLRFTGSHLRKSQ
jgi:hypothetical protein